MTTGFGERHKKGRNHCRSRRCASIRSSLPWSMTLLRSRSYPPPPGESGEYDRQRARNRTSVTPDQAKQSTRRGVSELRRLSRVSAVSAVRYGRGRLRSIHAGIESAAWRCGLFRLL
jgi:hypothetical protein